MQDLENLCLTAMCKELMQGLPLASSFHISGQCLQSHHHMPTELWSYYNQVLRASVSRTSRATWKLGDTDDEITYTTRNDD